MKYSHGPKKFAENVAKHGVWFHEADEFDWDTAVIIVDNRRQYAETHFRAIGQIGTRTL